MNDLTKKRSKQLVYILCFIGGFIIFLIFLSLLFAPKNNSKEAGIYDYLANGIYSEPEDSLDVLFLGDSETFASFIPLQIWDEHGIPSYCAATAGQNLANTYKFLKIALEKQSPKIVVLETHAIYSNVPYDEASNNILSKYFSIFEYHNRWKSLKKEDARLFSKKYTHTERDKGYYLGTQVAPADDSKYMAPSDDVANIDMLNMVYLYLIKHTCDKRGIKLIFVSTPSTRNWNMKRHNEIVDLSKKFGVDYMDLNLQKDEVPIDWNTDTRDGGDHLNYSGAKKVTEYIGKYLSESDLLTNRKSEKKYASWDKDYSEFLKQVQGN